MQYHLASRQWLASIRESVEVTAEGRASRRQIASALSEDLERWWDGYDRLTITFDSGLDDRGRTGISTVVRRRAEQAAEADGAETIDALNDYKGWSGPRYSVDDRLGPTFGLKREDSASIIAMWPNSRTLQVFVIEGRDIEPDSEPIAGLHHWHPDSMTSGLWYSRLSVAVPGVLCTETFRDEDGSYFSFVPEPSDADGLAEAVIAFLRSEYVYGVEEWLPVLYSLIGASVAELEPFRIELLPGTDNDRYELSHVFVDVSEATSDVMRHLASPTEEQCRRLVTAIRSYFSGDEHPSDREVVPPSWQAVLDAIERQ